MKTIEKLGHTTSARPVTSELDPESWALPEESGGRGGERFRDVDLLEGRAGPNIPGGGTRAAPNLTHPTKGWRF